MRTINILKVFVGVMSGASLGACSLVAEIQNAATPISTKTLPVINSTNSSDLVINGTCAPGLSSFVILKPEPAQTVECVEGVWEVQLDMSAVSDGVVNFLTDQVDKKTGRPIEFSTPKDTVLPVVDSLVLESGATLTNKTTLAYQVGGSKIAKVYVTEDSTCNSGGEWQSTSATVSVLQGDGLKGLYVKAMDVVGNTSACTLMGSIYLDQTPPVVTGLSDDLIVKGAKSWTWSCSDTNAPCEYRYQITQGAALAPVGIYGLLQTAGKTGDGRFYLNVQARDAAGNESAVKSVTVDLSSSLPLLTIQNSSPYFNANAVNLQLANHSFFDEIDLSNSSTCDTPDTRATADSFAWNLPAGEGVKTVSYRLKNTTTGNMTECNTTSITIDTIAPTISSFSSVAPSKFKSANFTVNVTFSEPVTDFTLADIQVANGQASGLTGISDTYSFVVTPDSQGLVTVDVASGVAIDVANNANSNAVSLSRTYDSVQPTLTLSTLAPDPTNAPFVVKAKFSESVTGFSLAGVSVTNGSASALAGSGDEYTFTVTPTTSGTVTVSVGAGVAADEAGNNNTAATSLQRQYDDVAPTITGLSDDPTWKTSKTWAWGCSESCTYRFVVDTISNTTPGGAFASVTTASQTTGSNTYYLHVEAKDDAGNTTVKHVSAKIDNTLPVAPSGVVDQVSKASLTDSPTITFTSGSDAHSGLKKHQARVVKASDASPVSSWVDFTSGSILSGLTLTTNTSYKVEVVSIDNADNISSSAYSDGWIADVTAPSAPTGLASGAVPVSQTTTPVLSWSASSDGAGGVGVLYYEARVFKVAGGTPISSWATLASGNAVSGLSLSQEGYYFKVRAVDALGNTSAESAASGAWTAVVDPCLGTPSAGAVCASGAIYVGVFNGKKYYTTPGGCTDSATPTCGGGEDSVMKLWSSNAYPGTDVAELGKYAIGQNDSYTGQQNTSILAPKGAYPAASYCDAMSFAGATDWFLPNQQELQFLVDNRVAVGGMNMHAYWSSTQGQDYLSAGNEWVKTALNLLIGNSWINSQKSVSVRVRCMRAVP